MDETETYAKLTSIFRDLFDDEEMVLTPQLTASEVDGWDSLAHVRLVLTVERAFKIQLSASEIGRLKNVGDLVALIAQKAP